MKNMYKNFYALALLAVGSCIYADSSKPYKITIINNSDSDNIEVKFTSRNTNSKKNTNNTVYLEKEKTKDITLTRDLRMVNVSGWSEQKSRPAYQLSGIVAGSNDVKNYRRGAQIFIYGNSEEKPSFIICRANTIQPEDYNSSSADIVEAGGVQFSKFI